MEVALRLRRLVGCSFQLKRVSTSEWASLFWASHINDARWDLSEFSFHEHTASSELKTRVGGLGGRAFSLVAIF